MARIEPDVIQFATLPSLYWDTSTKLSYLQRRILVYSLMYYEHDESCVPDYTYDGISHQLARMQAAATKAELEASRYGYAFYDFEGSTGFDLPSRLTPEDREHLERVVDMVYRQYKGHIPYKPKAKGGR